MFEDKFFKAVIAIIIFTIRIGVFTLGIYLVMKFFIRRKEQRAENKRKENEKKTDEIFLYIPGSEDFPAPEQDFERIAEIDITQEIMHKTEKRKEKRQVKEKINEKFITIDEEFISSAGASIDVIEPVWHSASIYDDEALYYKSLFPFTKEQSYIFALHKYFAEVHDGGHFQFYSNSTGIVWEEALAGAKNLGLEDVYTIIKKSVDYLGASPSKDHIEREELLDSISKENEKNIGALDDEIYALDAVFIEEKFMEYIKAHKEKFYFSGNIMY